MTEENKKLAIAAAIAIGVVGLIFLIFRGNGGPVAADTVAPEITPDVQPANYLNYNVPAFTPDLGDIIPPSQQSVWGQPQGEFSPGGGCGCGSSQSCGNGTPGMVGTVQQFSAMMGSYNP